MRISIEPDLIKAAIRLYAERGGAHGIHTWEVAEQVGCTDPSLYRIFKSKENLFYKAVATVVADVIKEFLYQLHAARSEATDIDLALLKWYDSLSRDSARILYFATFFSQTSREQASTTVDQMVVALAKHLHEEEHIPEKKAMGIARGVIYSLLQLKATQFPSAERKLAEVIIAQWLKE